jgi:hypothetical protein
MKEGKKTKWCYKAKKRKTKKNVIKTWSKNKKMPLKKHHISVKTQALRIKNEDDEKLQWGVKEMKYTIKSTK